MLLLNIDLGEHDALSPAGRSVESIELYQLADIANIACGGHAGNDQTMQTAIEHCIQFKTRLGAHPSFDDRRNFGRKEIVVPQNLLFDQLNRQLNRLASIALKYTLDVQFIKPHGALYHVANRYIQVAQTLVRAAIACFGSNISIIGPPSGALQTTTIESGLLFYREGFADRGYLPNGELIARGKPGSLIESPDLAIQQVVRCVQSNQYDTLCVHSDTPHALEIACAVRNTLDRFFSGRISE